MDCDKTHRRCSIKSISNADSTKDADYVASKSLSLYANLIPSHGSFWNLNTLCLKAGTAIPFNGYISTKDITLNEYEGSTIITIERAGVYEINYTVLASVEYGNSYKSHSSESVSLGVSINNLAPILLTGGIFKAIVDSNCSGCYCIPVSANFHLPLKANSTLRLITLNHLKTCRRGSAPTTIINIVRLGSDDVLSTL